MNEKMPPWISKIPNKNDHQAISNLQKLEHRLFGADLNDEPHQLWNKFVFEPEERTEEDSDTDDTSIILARRNEFRFDRCLYAGNKYRAAIYYNGIRNIWVVATKGQAVNRFLIYNYDSINCQLAGWRPGPWWKRFSNLAEKWIEETNNYDMSVRQEIEETENLLFNTYIQSINEN